MVEAEALILIGSYSQDVFEKNMKIKGVSKPIVYEYPLTNYLIFARYLDFGRFWVICS